VVLWLNGRGLPISALPPPQLVGRGPYRIVRHPIYLGFNLLMLGVGLLAGSRAMALVAAPALLPCWTGYALVEERGLVRRFGERYRRYRRRVGLLPKVSLYWLAQLAMALRAIPVAVEGRGRIPKGGCILVANHACYLDPLLVGTVTRRKVRYLSTVEVFRTPLSRWALTALAAFPLRRYRTDLVATREMLRLLEEGEIIGMFTEGERSPLGDLQKPLPNVAEILTRLPYPVIPVGVSGSYDVGPRWSDVLRRRPVKVRVGEPIQWGTANPAETLNGAIRRLMDANPQPLDLAGLPREKLSRVLWRCPECGEEARFSPERLRCDG
jgi:1-acyl-sn-glycerol-3-phosphate acyltransferase